MNNKKVLREKSIDKPKSVKKIPKFNGILGLISFSTILPLKFHTSIPEMALFTWFWPIIGGLIGLFVGAFGFITLNILHLPPLIVAALTYSFAIFFTGFHHLDGLMDMGDGLMVHGDHKKKMEVIKDTATGTGGISLFFIIAIITFSAISSIPAALIFYVLLISEIAAKISLISCATFSTPLNVGTGKYFIDSMNIFLLIFSMVITGLIGYFVLNLPGVFGILAALLGGYIIAKLAQRHFKYANGDILGASNEIGRAVSLIIIVICLIFL